MENNRIKNSIRNMIFGFFKYLIAIIFPFVTRSVLIYKLGTEYAGITSLFSSILQVLSLSELGFSTAIVFALYEPVANNNTERICQLLSFFRNVYRCCGLFILLTGICITPFVSLLIKGSYPFDINIYIVFLVLLINTSLSYLVCGYKSVIFSANQRDDILSKSTILANLCLYIMQIIALVLFENYYIYIFSMLVGTLINNVVMYIYAKKMYPQIYCKGKIDKEERKNLIKSVGSLFGHQLDMVIINSADNIIISMFLGLNILTIYNNYYYILNALLSVLVMVANSFAGSIGNSIAIETKEKNYKNFIDFTYFNGIVSNICVILLFVLYQDFMKLWMGESMMFNIGLVFLISFSLYIRQFRRSLITYKIAAGIWRQDALKPYIACAANLVLNIILVQCIGLYGVILSTIFSFAVIEIPWEISVFFKGYFKFGLIKYLKVQLILFIKMMGIGIVTYWVSLYIKVDNLFMFFLKALLLGVLCSFLFFIVSFKDEELSYIFKKIKRLKR